MTLSGIEPATFRFVAQHLNHCATAVPQEWGGWGFIEEILMGGAMGHLNHQNLILL